MSIGISNPVLFIELNNNETYACGNVRKHRKGLPEMEKKLNRGEISFKSTDNLLALK